MIRELVAATGLVLVAQSVQAQDQTIDLPAGQACAGFDLRIQIWDSPNRNVNKTFTDKDGNPVRLLSAGKGDTVAFTNLQTGASLSLKPNGVVSHVRLGRELSTWVFTGHVVLILFPTDVPAGPSTTLYVGRLVYTVDQSAVFTVQGSSGKSTDICAALSG
jgi:hypothetical protein